MTVPDIELVIFDCDGVLVDSEPLANRVFAEQLSAAGFSFSLAEAFRHLKGRSLAACLTWLEQHFATPLPADFVTDLQRATFAAFTAELKAVDGIETALAALRRPSCVASNGDLAKMRFTLGLTGLLPRFEGRLFSATEVRQGKPAPDLFLHAAARMGAEPSACLVIEDSPSGVQAAVAAGMPVLGYAGAAHSDAEAMAGSGARIFRRMADLPELIANGRG